MRDFASLLLKDWQESGLIMSDMRADLFRWSFLFWIGQVVATASIVAFMPEQKTSGLMMPFPSRASCRAHNASMAPCTSVSSSGLLPMLLANLDEHPCVRLLHASSTTMLRLKPRRRAVLVETLRELANLVAGALVLGRLVGNQP